MDNTADEATAGRETKRPVSKIDTRPAVARVQIARYDAFFNQRTMRYELRKTHKRILAKKAILLVKRIIDRKGQYEKTEIEIHHRALHDALLNINRDRSCEYLGLTKKTPTVSIRTFFYSFTALEDLRISLEKTGDHLDERDSDTLEGVQAALRYIDTDVRDTITDVEVLLSQRQITYELLWALFPPNAKVIGYHKDTEQRYVANAQTLEYTDNDEKGPHAVLTCSIIVYDGSRYGYSSLRMEVPEFPSARSIFELPAYPCQYYSDWDEFRTIAIRRAKQYLQLNQRPGCYRHEGMASLYTNGDADPEFRTERGAEDEYDPAVKLRVEERVMIDVQSFSEIQSASKFFQRVEKRLEPEKLSEDELLICTPVLLGFSLATKAWGAFAIDNISDAQWSEEPFDSLVLGQKEKELISCLVKEHTSRPRGFEDMITGKGQGLIGLLCGNPGCGKTLTAEAVAESSRKPLYAISAGEMGTDTVKTDIQLRRILRFGKRWNAVVLLDEADVFLRSRDTLDISRNAMVSIFLRQVEYYPGILIFTTNMVEQIDAAFESRIHFCVKYPDLDRSSREILWRTFLTQAGIPKENLSAGDLAQLSQISLNGRQIKNIVSTAGSIASARSCSTTLDSGPELCPSSELNDARLVRTLQLGDVRLVLDVMEGWRFTRLTRAHANVYMIIGIIGVVSALATGLWLWRCSLSSSMWCVRMVTSTSLLA